MFSLACYTPKRRPEAGLGASAGAAGLLLTQLRGFRLQPERRRQMYVLCAMCSCFAGLMPNAMTAVLLVLELGGRGGRVGGRAGCRIPAEVAVRMPGREHVAGVCCAVAQLMAWLGLRPFKISAGCCARPAVRPVAQARFRPSRAGALMSLQPCFKI